MAAQCYPRRLPILRKEVDQPAGRTLLHDFERFSTLCSSYSSSEGVSEDVSRHAQTARGTRYLCLQGTAVPRSPAPPSGSPALSSPCGQCFFATFQLLAVVPIPTTAQESRKGHVLLHRKRPFPSCLQTLHTCSAADCQQAEDRGRVSKKQCEPKCVNTDRKQQNHPHSTPNIPAPSLEQPLDFSSVLPKCPSGFGWVLSGMFFFDELGHKNLSSPSFAALMALKSFAF